MLIKEARKKGAWAFTNGLKMAPALNKAFLTEAVASATPTAELFKAYSHGWTIAHLAMGVTGDMPSLLRLKAIMEA